MTWDYANMAIAAAGVAGAFLGAGATYCAAWRQTPKPDVRIDGVALKWNAIGEGENLFIATVTNHGNAVAEIARTEVHATVDGAPVKASIGDIDVAGTLAAGASKELWLNVALPELMGNDVHDGRNDPRQPHTEATASRANAGRGHVQEGHCKGAGGSSVHRIGMGQAARLQSSRESAPEQRRRRSPASAEGAAPEGR